MKLCRKGHPLGPENRVIYKSGPRAGKPAGCRICQKAQYRLRKPEIKHASPGTPVEDRFHRLTFYAGDCIVWTGSTNNKGYGQFRGAVTMVLAHRYSYELRHGAIPEGLELDHLCRNPICVNPGHLEAVTSKVNSRRGLCHRRTHCRKGHELSDGNIINRPGGAWQCRACAKLRWTRSYERKKQCA